MLWSNLSVADFDAGHVLEKEIKKKQGAMDR